mmetsp:Transcript_12621/g.19568  ORF Transcript_12621/g.19568 Transcript_12621/m.19568 type:complete len:664 (-) Transcript_12621:81-2072(-)|eukprot:CAMPEP_0195282542 /NCGR_PEP_ID=MMETSP0707-20130614/1361_1 /TAXON_ID=33640 /ORGANISM="Asterionellopsis glacialis, Strain CCMP134" /LENGTH=663 /DNA_ID=CAMNT_0040341517 /DNA_START=155 /DNA_END=2146 /DNA_ORIENTATION=+
MARTALGRRRGTRSSGKNRHFMTASPVVVGCVVIVTISMALLLGIVIGSNALAPGDGTTATTTTSTRTASDVQQTSEMQQNVVGVQKLVGKAKQDLKYLRQRTGRGAHNLVQETQKLAQHERETLKHAMHEFGGAASRGYSSVSVHDNGNPNDLPEYPYLVDPVPSDMTFTSWTPKGGDRWEEWKDGDTPYYVNSKTLKQGSDYLARSRRVHIQKAMKFAWSGYETYAFGQDEIMPQSGKGHTAWGNLGTTLVDSLDTLWLMNMKDEFYRARDWVRDNLSHDVDQSVSVFETTIRSLGGLLSAYDWSGDKVFLEKAQDLGDRLIHAFDNPSGIPYGTVNLADGRTGNIGWAGGSAILAEFGTLQVEFRYLGKALGQFEHYGTKSEEPFKVLQKLSHPNGLFPYYIRNRGEPGFANNILTFGAMGDSIYEYMLKIWLQGGKTEPMYREMYDKAIQGMHDELLQKSSPSGFTYIADKRGERLDHKMDHLVCFMGGLLALGAYTDPLGLDSARAQRDLKTGKALTYTCYQTYARMETGISPEYVEFRGSNDFKIGASGNHYLLRPETVESFFILNQLTGDPVYREWGWEVFSAIERFCKAKYGYGSIHGVDNPSVRADDKMESFFLAETMKYLYLLQDPDTEVDILHKHVFNTEAHPMRVFPAMDH